MLTVIEKFNERDAKDRPRKRLKVRCECGVEKSISKDNLTKTVSCGCYKVKTNSTHRQSQTTTYKIWMGMIERCRNPRDDSYQNYGGRGIKVCERWKQFENFLADMGERPPSLTLERTNNSLGYSPENCKWATRTEQCNNSRHNRLVSANGITLNVGQWCKLQGFSHVNFYKRIYRGWTEQEAVLTPIGGKRNNVSR